jgi:hypothetical protein
MIREINALGVPPEKVCDYVLANGKIALGIARWTCDSVKISGYWRTLTPEDLAIYVATPGRDRQMPRTTLLQLFSTCHSELDAVRELGNLGFMASYVPPSYNLDALMASNTEYMLFVIPKKGWDGEYWDSKTTEERSKQTECLLNRVLFEVEDNRRANRELSRKLDRLQEETEGLKERLRSAR